MLHILIVDDEPNIVEGLSYLIQSMDAEGLDVSKAYSGKEALAMIREMPVDLVLSDIRMPGMSGLQLLGAIEQYWPACRIIFLTGYGQFESIHKAINSPVCAGYLLKTEGDEAILCAMHKEIDRIVERKARSTLLERARVQMTAMISVLRSQYLRLLVTEGQPPPGEDGFGPDRLGLCIDPSGPMLAVLGLMLPPRRFGSMESTRMALAVDEAMADSFGERAAHDFTLLDEGMAVWLLQDRGEPCAHSREDDGGGLAGYVRAGLQLVQNSIRQIGACASFAVASGPVEPAELPAKVRGLQAMAVAMGSTGAEMIIGEKQAEGLLPPAGAQAALRLQFQQSLGRLETLLGDGRANDFTDEFQSLLARPEGNCAATDPFCRTMLLTMLLAVAGKLNLAGEIAPRVRLQELLGTGGEDGSAVAQCLKLGQEICRLHLARMKSTADDSIGRVKEYVLHNIADKNLSLSRIAAHSFYNPSYLSRFFKQETGMNLSDHINDVRLNRALELLKNRDVRINEITGRVGFESPSYFTMFFKKRMGMTPNEYRAKLGQ